MMRPRKKEGLSQEALRKSCGQENRKTLGPIGGGGAKR